MKRFRRILPLVAVALGAVLVPVLASAATVPPESTVPVSSAPVSSAPTSNDPLDNVSGARQSWLASVEAADPETYAGGAPTASSSKASVC